MNVALLVKTQRPFNSRFSFDRFWAFALLLMMILFVIPVSIIMENGSVIGKKVVLMQIVEVQLLDLFDVIGGNRMNGKIRGILDNIDDTSGMATVIAAGIGVDAE